MLLQCMCDRTQFIKHSFATHLIKARFSCYSFFSKVVSLNWIKESIQEIVIFFFNILSLC